MINFNKILFSSILVSGSLISISALSWMSAWIGLEMNLLALIPLMKSSKNKLSTEASIKYFMVQAMASSSLLFSVILSCEPNFAELCSYPAPLLISNLALLLKMGAAPVHFWLPEVVSGLSWNLVFIVLTWQKVAPMILMSYCMNSTFLLSSAIILSSLVSGIMGMNQTCLRKIMAFSSINHVGWMLATLFSSLNLWFFYFVTYSIMNMSILAMFKKLQVFYFSQLNKMMSFNKNLKMFFMLNFLSLGGLPPFVGFLPKWFTINFLVYSNFLALGFILILITLITLFFYVRLALASFTLSATESLINLQTKNFNLKQFFFSTSVLLSLPMSFALSSML
uniref:NADH-ubiquinone oxidoreductase chain 2 n=1 Tax=Trigonopterus jasminae TaxID=2576128 RepID=A0A7H1KHU0_9CUCU|nr:NADH dehydrogenase subunit 2 [Trigonopterus jasminae]QNT26856.1 NADH dehydrogenase subunit 2 [Trigonopterus jasminae]